MTDSNKPLLFKSLDPRAILPTRKHPTDAGLDLYSIEEVKLKPIVQWNYGDSVHYSHRFNTGIAVAIPSGMVGIICDKSGRGDKLIKVFGGVIDSDYRGPIQIRVANFGWETWNVQPGMALAQLLILPCELMTPLFVDNLETTERGESGFGSVDLTK
jgi:dUTP pyrophosphatase